MPENEPQPEPEEITLEEWIAATQSCCGIEPESRRKQKPKPASEPAADAVQSGVEILPSPSAGEGGRASRPGEGECLHNC